MGCRGIFLVVLAFGVSLCFADDLGFRYQGGKCVNSAAQEGLNPDCVGQCGDHN